MSSIGNLGYALSAALFLFLSMLLVTSWRGRLQGALLASATFMTAIWATTAAYVGEEHVASIILPVLEILRNALWFVFFLKLLSVAEGAEWYKGRLRPVVVSIALFVFVLLSSSILFPFLSSPEPPSGGQSNALILGFVVLAVIGLVLVEQVFRNIRPDRRWAIKFLCLGAGGLFAYDFFLYSDALLFNQIDSSLWDARGAVNALVVPLIAVSAARNPQWSLDVFVSRGIIFHAAALLGAGIYLLAMAAGGYYIRYYGGQWGVVAQIIFLFGATLLLLVLLFSGQVRARCKVFLNKHFFNYKYDYREEWLRFTRILSSEAPDMQLRERVIRALAEIVDSSGGILWLRQESGAYEPVSHFTLPDEQAQDVANRSPLVRFLENREWVINLDEYRHSPEAYQGLDMPSWLADLPGAWLVVPLMHHERLLAFLVVARSRAPRLVNWEDNDLLKMAGRQAASHLAQFEATQALVDARQFEACNRLSAFVVHDLKNLIAQLSLMISNAAKHRHNPAFIDDMIATTEHTVERMNRLLLQLRTGKGRGGQAVPIHLATLLEDVIASKSSAKPVPELICVCRDLVVKGDRDRLAAIFGHIMQNAQDATAVDGWIEVRLKRQSQLALIDIEDNGCGMDPQYIRDHLFKPFDSTKGESGMGIGAYESREIIRELGGEINVISEPNVGSTFSIRLPAYTSESDKAKTDPGNSEEAA